MASFYLIGSGDWNGAVWSSSAFGPPLPYGVVPTASDDVFLWGTHEVTLTEDAECASISQTPGPPPVDSGPGVGVLSHKLTVHGAVDFYGYMWGTGTLEADNGFRVGNFNSTGSLTVILNVKNMSAYFDTIGNDYEDVIINMGEGTSYATSLTISDSPTFRSLIIQSKNSAAHTVNFGNSDIAVSKLVVVGSSISNRLLLRSPSGFGRFVFSESGSCYGRAVDTGNFGPMGNGVGTNNFPVAYIGSDSIGGAGTYNWRYEDPPKISTLVDPLTTAPTSNTNWSVLQDGSGVVQITNGHGGGGYNIRGMAIER